MKTLIKNKLLVYIFFIPFVLTSIYISLIQTELYKSSSSVLIKDLSNNQTLPMDLGIFSAGTSGVNQDAAIMEEYLRSHEVYSLLDQKYTLTKYYQSDEIDILNRVVFSLNTIKLMYKYNNDLEIILDELSGIITISFYHANPSVSLDIAKELLNIAETKLNKLNKTNSQKILKNIILTVKKNKKKLDSSTQSLEKYQNKNNLIDPQMIIEQKNALISSLQTSLIEKEVKYSNLKNYTGYNNLETKQLENEIRVLKKTISKEKRDLSGESSDTINRKYFEFEKLKSQVEFDKEVYKQSLAQYELMKTQTTQNSKTIQIIVLPKLADAYSMPDKPKNIITAFILYAVIFGIIYFLRLIIKDHQD